MPVRSDEGIDGIAIEVFEIPQIDDDIPHVVFDEESNGVLQLGGIENLAIGESCGDNVEDANRSNIELDMLPPRELHRGSLSAMLLGLTLYR
jgi:hypothetical protein